MSIPGRTHTGPYQLQYGKEWAKLEGDGISDAEQSPLVAGSICLKS
jgi:hypothetical protein